MAENIDNGSSNEEKVALFREYDSGKLSEAEYVASAKRLQELVETAYDAGRISEKTYFAFTEEYGVNIQYVTGI